MITTEILLDKLIGLVADFKLLAETAKKLDKPEVALHIDGACIFLLKAIEQMGPNAPREGHM